MEENLTTDIVTHLKATGNEVFDAVKGATISIIQDDIDKAVPNNRHHCVGANCIRRAFAAKRVIIGRGHAYVQFDEKPVFERFLITKAMKDNVINPLDSGNFDDIIPGRYDLRAPKNTEKLGEGYKRRKNIEDLRSQGLAPPVKRRIGPKNPPIKVRLGTIDSES